MTRDLFRLLFNHYSRWDFEEYHSQFIERLPHRFVQGALATNPSLQSCSGFAELSDILSSTEDSRWKNPELYPHLNRVIIPNYPFLQSSVDALRIHTGLQPLDDLTGSIQRMWRLHQPTPHVFEFIDNKIQLIDAAAASLYDTRLYPIVYRPCEGLFDDIEPLYQGGGDRHDIDSILALSNDAIKAISSYSSDIAESICQRVCTISYMPNRGGSVNSFTKRNYYIGGVFLSISHPIKLAEQLIHEYYHQCIWPWWMVEPPEDLPDDSITVTSPVTGRERSATVMIHAFLIYYSLADFYRFVLYRSDTSSLDIQAMTEAKARLSKIEAGLEPLRARLTSALSERKRTLALVNAISEFGRNLASRI